MDTTLTVPLPEDPDCALPIQLLTDEVAVDRRIATPAGATALLPALTALTLAGFGAHAVVIAGVAWPALGPDALRLATAWFAAVSVGFFAAISAGLPSYWFYGVVARIRAPAWRLAVELVRIQAVGAVVLAGVLPFWLAGALGLHLLLGVRVYDSAPWMAVTYALPFLCGTPGLAGLYRAFLRMREALGVRARTAPLLLTAWWSVLFLFTAPAAIRALFLALW